MLWAFNGTVDCKWSAEDIGGLEYCWELWVSGLFGEFFQRRVIMLDESVPRVRYSIDERINFITEMRFLIPYADPFGTVITAGKFVTVMRWDDRGILNWDGGFYRGRV